MIELGQMNQAKPISLIGTSRTWSSPQYYIASIVSVRIYSKKPHEHLAENMMRIGKGPHEHTARSTATAATLEKLTLASGQLMHMMS